MQSYLSKRLYSFRVDANALGGFLEAPLTRNIPTIAPVSLPAVGGIATARSEAFNLEEIVSCSGAYTRVSGTEDCKDGSVSILTTAVVEGLNLLEVVTAERVVAQVSISIAAGGGAFTISTAGSRFEGLRLAGIACDPIYNPELIRAGSGPVGHALPLSWSVIEKAGRSQASKLIAGVKAGGNKEAVAWAVQRHDWMTADPLPATAGTLLCSLVDGFKDAPPIGNFGHIVEIPGFGRIFLGELRMTHDSIQLVAIRAELGCPITGKISICCGGGGGTGEH
jgi:hypothetical protein